MKNLHEHDTDLCTYMKAMGVLCLKHDKKIKTDSSHENIQNDKSDSNLPEISHVIVSNVRKSIAGEELRNIRLQNDYTLNFEESIIPTQSTTEKLPITKVQV